MSIYATWNPLDKSANVSLSGGDLIATLSSANWGGVRANIGNITGKWYWEITCTGTYSGDAQNLVGISHTADYLYPGTTKHGWARQGNGLKRHNNGSTAYSDAIVSGDVFGFAVDIDAGKVWTSKNGVWVGDPVAGTGEMYEATFRPIYPAVGAPDTNITWTANFGDSAFTYAVPAGYNSGWYADTSIKWYAPTASGDDGYGHTTGSFVPTTMYTAIGNDNPSVRGFVRFPAIPIAAGSHIISAKLGVVAYGNGSNDDCNIRISLNAVDDAVAPTSHTQLYALASTTAVVDMSTMDPWIIEKCYNTLDISACVQEVIDRPGWAYGNAITVILSDNASTALANRLFASYNYNPAKAQLLYLEWAITAETSEDTTVSYEADADVYGSRFIAEDASVTTSFLDNMGETTEEATASFSLDDNLANTDEDASVTDSFDTVGSQFNTEKYEEVSVRTELLGTTYFAHSITDGFAAVDAPGQGLYYQNSVAESIVMTDIGTILRIFYVTNQDSLMVYDDLRIGWNKSISDPIVLADTITSTLGIIIHDWLTLIDSIVTKWQGSELIDDSFIIYDESGQYKLVSVSISEAIQLADSQILKTIVQVFEYLGFSEIATGILTTTRSVSDILDLSDEAIRTFSAALTDVLSVVDAGTLLAQFTRSIQESLGVTDLSSVLRRLFVTNTETIRFAETITSKGTLYSTISDGLKLSVLIELAGEYYECYALNTPKFFPSMYSGFDFNSYCVFENRVYAANDTGIFELTGDDDAGSTIHTGVVLHSSDFGSAQQKRFRRGYLSISGDAPKLILETDSGEREVYDIDTNGKVVTSHRLKGKTWTISVSDFDSLDGMTLIPVLLSR